MNDIATLKEEMAAYLSASGHLDDVEVMTAYPCRETGYPLRKPVVAVGLGQVEVSPAGLGGFWGETATDSLLGSGARITLCFHLYAPHGEGPHILYESLCDCLLLEESPFGCQSLTCGEQSYDRAAAAWRMSAHLTLHTALVRRERGSAIEGFHIHHNTQKE